MKKIVALDKKLQKGLDLIEEHQKVHRKLLQMENEIDAENQVLMDFALALKTGKEQLDICLEEARTTKRAIRTAEECMTNNQQYFDFYRIVRVQMFWAQLFLINNSSSECRGYIGLC